MVVCVPIVNNKTHIIVLHHEHASKRTMPSESAVTALRVVAPHSVGGCGDCGRRVSLSPLASSLALALLPRSCLLLVREEAVGALSARIREGYEARFGVVVPPLFVTRAGTSARVLLQPDSESNREWYW